MHDIAFISSSKGRQSFQLCVWAFTLYRNLNYRQETYIISNGHILSAPTLSIVRPLVAMYLLLSFVLTY